MRDILKNNGLKILINEIKEINPSTKIDIASALFNDSKESLKRALLIDCLEKTIAHYSIGDDKETVKQALLETIDAFEDGFEHESFETGYGDMDNMAWIVSLSILCDVELEDFKRVAAIIKRDNANDSLLNTLIKSKLPEWGDSYQGYIQKHPYASTKNIHNANDIKKYLNKIWYKGHSDSYWHNSHKNNKVNLYFGYWAWEVAALVKVKGIDDSSLKEQKYYPYDAVHW